MLSYTTDANDPAQQYFQVYRTELQQHPERLAAEVPAGVVGSRTVLDTALPYSPPGSAGQHADPHGDDNCAGSRRSGRPHGLPAGAVRPGDTEPSAAAAWQELAGLADGLQPGAGPVRPAVHGHQPGGRSDGGQHRQRQRPVRTRRHPDASTATYSGPDAASCWPSRAQHTQGAQTLLQAAHRPAELAGFQGVHLQPEAEPARTSNWLLSFLTTDRRGVLPAVRVGVRGPGPAGRDSVADRGRLHRRHPRPGTRPGRSRRPTRTPGRSSTSPARAGCGSSRHRSGAGGQGTATVPGYATGASTGPDAPLPGGQSQTASNRRLGRVEQEGPALNRRHARSARRRQRGGSRLRFQALARHRHPGCWSSCCSRGRR